MTDKQTPPIERLYRDGKTAVLISPGYGYGWSSWNSDNAEFLLHDRLLCQYVLDRDYDKVRGRCDAVLGEDEVYGDLLDLVVVWVPTGAPFYVHEYDGSERIVTEFRSA